VRCWQHRDLAFVAESGPEHLRSAVRICSCGQYTVLVWGKNLLAGLG
jgi:hypothetical protein